MAYYGLLFIMLKSELNSNANPVEATSALDEVPEFWPTHGCMKLLCLQNPFSSGKLISYS